MYRARVRDENVTSLFGVERNLRNKSAALRPRFVQRRDHGLGRCRLGILWSLIHMKKRARKLVGEVRKPLMPANDDAESPVG
jgi:hypothetical protein